MKTAAVGSGVIAFCRRAARTSLILAAALWLASVVPGCIAAADVQRMPDGEVAVSHGYAAYLVGPTEEYDHGVLGDAIEAGGFVVETPDRVLEYRLERGSVFEDRRVRLADMDGDGVPEAIVIKSYLQLGSAIAIYRIGANGIFPLAESASIGVRHRWLNVVGIADFTGSGEPMIAAVITPHLRGSLRLYRLTGRKLESIARIDGLTNHIAGSRDLDLGRIDTGHAGRAPRIVLPTLDRASLAVVSFKHGRARIISRAPVPGRIASLLGASNGVALVRTEQGRELSLDLRRCCEVSP